jgi:hypothetical protein
VLTGETWFHCEFVHPQHAIRRPPRGETNGGPTRPVGLCIEVKLQGLHRIPLQQLDRGSNWSLCCEVEEDLQGRSGMESGEGICDHSLLFTLSVLSLVKLRIVDAEPRARPMINHVSVTNVVRQR